MDGSILCRQVCVCVVREVPGECDFGRLPIYLSRPEVVQLYPPMVWYVFISGEETGLTEAGSDSQSSHC